ncbi:MAG: hypothetical protein C0405_09810 [Desulfovibrio sp.]|nr:hypothetical protein [Desulfovibrio sp.]
MGTFADFLDMLKKELVEFAEYSWKDFKDAAVADGKDFLDSSKADLERWTKMLAKGELSRDDFEWLVVGKKDLAELTALKRLGLALVARDRFVNGLIDTIVATAFKVFLP